MQIITPEQVIQTIELSRSVTSELFGVFLNAIGENIVNFAESTWSGLLAGDLSSVGVSAIMLTCSLIMGYRTVRNNVSHSIDYVFSSK